MCWLYVLVVIAFVEAAWAMRAMGSPSVERVQSAELLGPAVVDQPPRSQRLLDHRAARAAGSRRPGRGREHSG